MVTAPLLGSPRISIVIPCYNGERYLAATLETVQAQSFENWELIVVDDCSTDGSRELVQRFVDQDPRIQLLALSKNYGGPAGPRNRGVEIARGEWISFLDADDLWHPLKLEHQLAAMEKTGGVLSATRMQNFTDTSSIVVSKELDRTLDTVTFSQQRLRSRIPASSVFVRREICLEFSFNEDPSYKAVEDYNCWLHMLNAGHVCHKLNGIYLHYRIVAGQISGSKRKQVMRVHHVHSHFPGNSQLGALFYTFSHISGAIYSRLLKGQM